MDLIKLQGHLQRDHTQSLQGTLRRHPVVRRILNDVLNWHKLDADDALSGDSSLNLLHLLYKNYQRNNQLSVDLSI